MRSLIGRLHLRSMLLHDSNSTWHNFWNPYSELNKSVMHKAVANNYKCMYINTKINLSHLTDKHMHTHMHFLLCLPYIRVWLAFVLQCMQFWLTWALSPLQLEYEIYIKLLCDLCLRLFLIRYIFIIFWLFTFKYRIL